MSGTVFYGGEPDFRAARLRCALACQAYNRQDENTPPQERSRLWNQ
jgi:hypothetical protein